MKRFFFLALMVFMGLTVSNRAVAQDSSVSVEYGSTSGTYQFRQGGLSEWNKEYALKGGYLGLVYSRKLGTGIINDYLYGYGENVIYGGGYHSYEASGEGSLNGIASFKTKHLKLSGLFALLGYDWRIIDQLSFQPQLRLGIANKIEWSQDVVSQESVSYSESGSVIPILVILPVSYEIPNVALGSYELSNFVLGAQYQLHSVGISAAVGDATKHESMFASSIALSVGYLF